MGSLQQGQANDYFVTLDFCEDGAPPHLTTADLEFDGGLQIRQEGAPDPQDHSYLRSLIPLLTQNGRFRVTVEYDQDGIYFAHLFVDSREFKQLMETLGTFPGERRLGRLLNFVPVLQCDRGMRAQHTQPLPPDEAARQMIVYEQGIATGELTLTRMGYIPVGRSGYGAYPHGPFGTHFSPVTPHTHNHIRVSGGFLMDNSRTRHERILSTIQTVQHTHGYHPTSDNPLAASYWPTSATLVIAPPEAIFGWTKYAEHHGLEGHVLLTEADKRNINFKKFSRLDIVVCSSDLFLQDSSDPEKMRKRFYARRQCMARKRAPVTLVETGIVDFFWTRVVLDGTAAWLHGLSRIQCGSLKGHVMWLTGAPNLDLAHFMLDTIEPCSEDEIWGTMCLHTQTTTQVPHVLEETVNISLTPQQQYMYNTLVQCSAPQDTLLLFCCGRERDMTPNMNVVTVDEAFNLGSAYYDEILDSLRDATDTLPEAEMEEAPEDEESEDDSEAEEDGDDEDYEEEDLGEFDTSDEEEEEDEQVPPIPLETQITNYERTLQTFTTQIERVRTGDTIICDICLENPVQVMNICSHMLCLACVYRIRATSDKCPFCRGAMEAPTMYYIKESSPEDSTLPPESTFGHRYPKIGATLQIVSGIRHSIVFCRFAHICHFISQQLTHAGVQNTIVSGINSCENLQWFYDNNPYDGEKVAILHWNAGMREALVPMASHVIFYHYMPPNERQRALECINFASINPELRVYCLSVDNTVESL